MLALLLAVAGCDGNNGDGGGIIDDGNDTPEPDRSFPDIELTEFISGVTQPTHITGAGDGSGRLFVVERGGTVRIVRDGALEPDPFLDITGRVGDDGSERGLLSMAFPPDFSAKQYFYVDYTDISGDTVVSRFSLTADPDVADEASEEVILTAAQPFANHNGGQLAFGPDGFLYISLGDGGSGGDPQGNGQNRDTLLGTILRIDVEHGGADPYLIPDDNPFGDEVWAYGLRNPWRFSFDRLDGDLYIADVGEQMIEEIDVQPASSDGGENYGWNVMEGSQCFSSASCDRTGLVLPVAEYDHQDGDCSVTGGHVYRAAEFPDLQGIYFYADYCSGKLWGLQRVDGDWEDRTLLDTPYRISTFGEDENGRLYAADYSAGVIYKLEPAD